MSTKKAAKTGKTGKSDKLVVPEEGSRFELSKIKEFIREVKNEFQKIAWPDKKHTLATAGVVVMLVIMISIYLGAVDLILGKLIGFVIN